MKLNPLATIQILFCILGLFKYIKCSQPLSKFDFFMNSITAPHKNVFVKMHDEFDKGADQLSQYLGFAQLETEKSASPTISEAIDVTNEENNENILDIFEESDSQGRMLAENQCYSGGELVTTTRLDYTCYGEKVNRWEYENFGGSDNPNCSTANVTAQACYCPIDFYGARCQYFVGITCTIEQLNLLNNCSNPEEQDSLLYSGANACIPIQVGEILELEFNVTCTYRRSEWAYEGIKRRDYYFAPVPAPKEFNYSFKGQNLKLSFPLDNCTLNVNFINFKWLTKPLRYSTIIKSGQLERNEVITVYVVVTDWMKENIPVAGRYFYEVTIFNPRLGRLGSQSISAFEVAFYQEPEPKSDTGIKALIITLVVVGLVLVCMLYYFLVYRRQKMEQRLLREMVVEQIIDDDTY